MKTRRDFLAEGVLAAAGCAAGGCVGTAATRAPALAGDFVWGALLHLGSNMWRDWVPGERYPQSAEEEVQFVRDGKMAFTSSRLYGTRDYFSTDWPCWRRQLEAMKESGLNTVFIDVGEAYAYPSHPELWVKGALDFGRMQQALAEIRNLGMEPVPKLNFSTGHDQWLREYHYMTSSPTYYRVVADVIRDTCEVFGFPRYFHLGFDEEIFAAVERRQLSVMRQGDLWWKDFLFCAKEVERHGARAILWSDKICGGREEYLKRMPKSVIQMTWYYGKDFSEKNLTWKPEFEKSQKWNIQTNLAASIPILAEAGYDLMPCTSNWSDDGAADAMLAFCRQHVDPKRISGFVTAPWRKPVPEDMPKALDGIRLFADAKRRHYS